MPHLVNLVRSFSCLLGQQTAAGFGLVELKLIILSSLCLPMDFRYRTKVRKKRSDIISINILTFVFLQTLL